MARIGGLKRLGFADKVSASWFVSQAVGWVIAKKVMLKLSGLKLSVA